mgnify:CR=1
MTSDIQRSTKNKQENERDTATLLVSTTNSENKWLGRECHEQPCTLIEI